MAGHVKSRLERQKSWSNQVKKKQRSKKEEKQGRNWVCTSSRSLLVGERRKPPSNIGVRDRDGDGDFLRHAVLQHAHAQSHAAQCRRSSKAMLAC
eukprot:767616-Hanusia_phi.AAC.2